MTSVLPVGLRFFTISPILVNYTLLSLPTLAVKRRPLYFTNVLFEMLSSFNRHLRNFPTRCGFAILISTTHNIVNNNNNNNNIIIIITHADGIRVSIAIIRVCDSVCGSVCLSVRTIIPKRLKLEVKSPNLAQGLSHHDIWSNN